MAPGALYSGLVPILQMPRERAQAFLNFSFSICQWEYQGLSYSRSKITCVKVWGSLEKGFKHEIIFFDIYNRQRALATMCSGERLMSLSLGGLFSFYKHFNSFSAAFKDLILQKIAGLEKRIKKRK